MFGRAAIRKSTGKLIEFQSGDAPLGTLKSNAIKSGIPEDDIEEKYVDSMPQIPVPIKEKQYLNLKNVKTGEIIKFEVI